MRSTALFFLLILMVSFNLKAKDTLIIGYSQSAPFLFEKNDKLQGPLFWLWSNVSDESDIVSIYKKTPSEKLLEWLEEGRIDVSLYPLTITSERAEKIDFTAPYYLAHSGVMERTYGTWDKAKKFLSSFFSLNFFRALLALFFIILIFGFFAWLFERKNNKEEFGGGLSGLWSGFWWSAVTMTTVGYGDKSPRTTGGRIVALIWMFTAVMIVSGFTASIASSLTLTEIESDSSSIGRYKDKRVGTVRNSSTLRWMNDNFFNNQVLYDRKEQLIEAFRNEEVDAVFYDVPLLKELIRQEGTQDFKVLPIRFNPQFYAFALNQDLPNGLKKKISTTMLELTENLEWDVVLSEYGLKRR
ncbi:MAG: ion channel [Bacteroidota bacterium]